MYEIVEKISPLTTTFCIEILQGVVKNDGKYSDTYVYSDEDFTETEQALLRMAIIS